MPDIARSSTSGAVLKCRVSKEVMMGCNCFQKPEIDLSGTLTWDIVECDNASSSNIATVSNVGPVGTVLNWQRTLSLDAGITGYMTALPATGTLNSGSSEGITVTLASDGTIAAGDYAGTLEVSDALIAAVEHKTLLSSHQILTSVGLKLDYLDQVKTSDATYCVSWPQVLARKRVRGYWQLTTGSAKVYGPVEMAWRNVGGTDYWESKYIYYCGGTQLVYVTTYAGAVWNPVWVWVHGAEPAVVTIPEIGP